MYELEVDYLEAFENMLKRDTCERKESGYTYCKRITETNVALCRMPESKSYM